MKKSNWLCILFLLTLTGIMSAPASAALKHYWKCDESPGASTLVDSVGAADGTILSGVTVVEGVKGNAIHMDGSANGHVSIANFSTDDLKIMTLTFWVKLDLPFSAGQPYKRIISGGDYWEAIIDAGSGQFANNLYHRGGVPYPLSAQPAPAEEWVHIAMTSELMGTGSGRMELYVNGVLESEMDAKADDDWSGGELRFGHRPGVGDNQHFQGTLDDIRMYDEILTADDIAKLMAGLGAPTLVAPDMGEKNIASPANLQWTFTPGDGADIQYDKYLLYLTSDPNLLNTSAYLLNGQEVSPASATDPAASYQVEGIAEGTDYYWWVDSVVLEPNVTNPSVYDVPSTLTSDLWTFSGLVVVPELVGPQDFYVLPDPASHTMPADPAVFTVGITAGKPVEYIKWYKDGIEFTGGVVTYDPDLENATSTTLTLANPDKTDEGRYSCEVKLVGSADNKAMSEDAGLYVSSDILVHHWNFNGTLDDVANPDDDSLDAVIVDPAEGGVNIAFNESNTELVFNGELIDGVNMTSDDQYLHYVDLKNGIVSELGDNATFMAWYTITDPATPDNVRLFTAGDADGSGTEAEWVLVDVPDPDPDYYQWSGMTGDGQWIEIVTRDGNISFGSRGANALAVNDGKAADYLNQQICLAAVWDGPNQQITLYLNGQQVATGTPNRKLSDLVDVSNWLGRSNSTADKTFVGSINDFRIYDVPLSAPWIEEITALGPDGELDDANPCLTPPAYDFNDDCRFDLSDLAIFSEQWLQCGKYSCLAD